MRAKRQILFIQGGGEGAHEEWDSKLVESLRRGLGKDYEILYPRMPGEDNPAYTSWKTAIEREIAMLPDEEAILIGHSLGGTILLNVLAEQPPARNVGALVLISAPFVGDGGWPSDELRLPPDLGARLPQGAPIQFFHGLDDEVAPPSHLDLHARSVPSARIHRLEGRDHQLNGDLREVAEAILSLEARR